MARHHHYSKRSRESRKAMTDGPDQRGYLDGDDAAVEDWQAAPDDPERAPGPVS